MEYNFRYTTDRPGLWRNIGEQHGSLVALNKYNQFQGWVQVVKAVGDHLILTFCASDEQHSIFTIILGRDVQGLPMEVYNNFYCPYS